MALFTRPQVPMTITAETTRLTTGSSHSQPVSAITIPAATTLAVTTVSAAMCRNALLRLRSRWLPEAKRRAVTPLTRMPAAATQITTVLATGRGWPIRHRASHAMPPVTTSRMTALASAARIELLRRP